MLEKMNRDAEENPGETNFSHLNEKAATSGQRSFTNGVFRSHS
jgi:hypothetical protein